MGAHGQNMIDMDALSAHRGGGWSSGTNNLNRFNNTLAGTASTNANNLTLQNQQIANQAALNALLQNQYLNPLGANFLQNSTQGSQQMLLAHQNSGDTLDFNSALGNPGGLDQ